MNGLSPFCRLYRAVVMNFSFAKMLLRNMRLGVPGLALLIATVQAALAIETRATGGFISKVTGPPIGPDGTCSYYGETESQERWCNRSTWVTMNIDGPAGPTARYSVTCRALDESGKLLAARAASNAEHATDDSQVGRATPSYNPPYWWGLIRLDVALNQIARIECEAHRVP
jgi:hypothetical protein